MTQLQRLVISPDQISQSRIVLTPEQQHYLGRVLRLRAGDRFVAMNGRGQWWMAALDTNPSQAEILEAIAAQTELSVAIHLLIAMPKNGMDDVIRQATELGVVGIQPLISDRTVLKPSPQKLERWQRIAQEAAEQSERLVVPEVLSPTSWMDALVRWNSSYSTCYLCEARGDYPHLLSCLTKDWRSQTADYLVPDRSVPDRSVPAHSSSEAPDFSPSPPLAIAIGPEGGWTDSEIANAIAAGYQPVSLGMRVLRAVTAPVVALSLVASVIESMPAISSDV